MKFQRLTVEDHDRLKPYFERQPWELCAYSLPSLLSWTTTQYHPVGLEIDDSLVVAANFPSNPALDHMILPISPERVWTPEEVAGLCDASGYDTLWFVPDAWLERFDRHEIETLFEVDEQTAYEDYIYEREKLAGLSGRKLAKKRNLISQFERAMEDHELDVSFITRENGAECIDLLEAWCKERNCDADPETDLACEKIAAKNAIGLIDDTDMRGLLLRIDGKIQAFGIANRLTDTMGVLHFEKALSSVKGLYQYFDRECARRLFSDSVTFINKESDMDAEGLAKAKKSYYPVKMVKSWRLKRK